MRLLRRTPTDTIAAALEQAGIPTPIARELSEAGTPLNFDAGIALCQKGSFGKEAFVLVRGEAVVRLADGDHVVVPGDVFGEIATLDFSLPRTATVETTEPSVVLVYDAKTFRYLAEKFPSVLAPEREAVTAA